MRIFCLRNFLFLCKKHVQPIYSQISFSDVRNENCLTFVHILLSILSLPWNTQGILVHVIKYRQLDFQYWTAFPGCVASEWNLNPSPCSFVELIEIFRAGLIMWYTHNMSKKVVKRKDFFLDSYKKNVDWNKESIRFLKKIYK